MQLQMNEAYGISAPPRVLTDSHCSRPRSCRARETEHPLAPLFSNGLVKEASVCFEKARLLNFFCLGHRGDRIFAPLSRSSDESWLTKYDQAQDFQRAVWLSFGSVQ